MDAPISKCVHWLRTPRGVFWSVIFSVAVIKLIFSLSTIGTNDVLFFQAYAQKLQAEGPVALYRDGIVLLHDAGPQHPEGFAHPPFIIHLLEFLNWVMALTGLSFAFLFRLLSILADIGSAVLLREILNASPDVKDKHVTACLFAGAPLLIFLSGFHGNTDPVMMFFLILCVWLLLQRRVAWMAGLAFGMSFNIKMWPLMLVPTIFFYIPKLRDRLWFSATATGIFLLGALPVAAQDPELVASRMFAYVSLFGHWGLSRVLALTGPAPVLDYFGHYGRYVLMLAAMVAGIWMYWSKAGLAVRIGVISSMFLALTPGFGIQYLSWLLPWVAFLGSDVLLIYLICTGVFMFHVYTFWSNGFPWNLADSTLIGTWKGFIVWYELLCWLSVVFCFILFLQKAAILKSPVPESSELSTVIPESPELSTVIGRRS